MPMNVLNNLNALNDTFTLFYKSATTATTLHT